MPRFVVLWHTLPVENNRPAHFDLMLEAGESLRTWAIERFPPAGEMVSALPLPPHRLDYLTYEGPVSQNRGEVTRWDSGSYAVISDSPTQFCAMLQGVRLGHCRLILTLQETGWQCELEPRAE